MAKQDYQKTNNQVDIAVMANDISYIKGEVQEIKEMVKSQYVTRDEFDPIRKLVYGMVALILSTVVLAIVATVIVRK